MSALRTQIEAGAAEVEAIDPNEAVEANAKLHQVEGRGPWQLSWARLSSDRMAWVSATVIALLILIAIFAPVAEVLTGHPVNYQYPSTALDSAGIPVGPGQVGFALGADNLGRDVLVRVAYGARVSLFAGLSATLIATIIGVAIGMTSGYLGGKVDVVLARLMDAVLSFPYVLLAIALASLIGPSLPMSVAVIAFFSWASIGRVVRGQTLSIKEKEYIEAARSLGASDARIMFVDVLPNLMAPVIVLATLLIPAAIVFEATLSFLGVGVPPPTPSWGNMISDAQSYYEVAWWFVFIPGAALLLTTLSFNLLGDSVRDALDPRTERIFAARIKRKGK
jgi:ABC-type dipeptide/oligopeptide/nickel transport system permease subunit